jgi:Mn2+/Fe2+ NRAMP family transporter
MSAMADALRLIMGGSQHLYVLFFGVLSLLLQVFIPYKRYVRILKWLTLALAYIATVFVVKVPWAEVLGKTFVPHSVWSRQHW